MREAVETIRRAQRLTAIGHENPDADTLGAALAIRVVGERLGIPAEVVMADPVPEYLQFLPGVAVVRSEPQLEPDVAERLFPSLTSAPKGIDLYAVLGADGTPLALTDSRHAAIANAIENDLVPVSVH